MCETGLPVQINCDGFISVDHILWPYRYNQW